MYMATKPISLKQRQISWDHTEPLLPIFSYTIAIDITFYIHYNKTHALYIEECGISHILTYIILNIGIHFCLEEKFNHMWGTMVDGYHQRSDTKLSGNEATGKG